jgi:hypothetical protein
MIIEGPALPLIVTCLTFDAIATNGREQWPLFFQRLQLSCEQAAVSIRIMYQINSILSLILLTSDTKGEEGQARRHLNRIL